MSRGFSPHSLLAMMDEFRREFGWRRLFLDGAAISGLFAVGTFAALHFAVGAQLMALLDASVLVLLGIPVACLVALGTISRFDDKEFVLFMKVARVYNTLELQIAYYKAACLASLLGGLVLYVVRGIPGPGTYTWITGAVVVGVFVWCIVGTYLAFRTRQKFQGLHDRMGEILGPPE